MTLTPSPPDTKLAPVPLTYTDALLRLEEAEETLRAISRGEIDAFVFSDGEAEQRVFTLATADRSYRRFVENMRDGAATLSPSGVVLYANRRLAELLSCSMDQLRGARLAAFLSRDLVVNWEAIRGTGVDGAAIELDLIDVRGKQIPVLVGISPLGEDDNEVTCLTFTDLSVQKALDREIVRLSAAQADRLSDLQRAQAALTMQATHDALTGLPNRQLLVDRIDQTLQRATRSHECTAVYFIDLDGFKLVNDTRGHAMGNRVLREVADRLVATLREMDTVARIGGDEFVVLAPAVSSGLAALELGDRLAKELASYTSTCDARVSASIGISISEGGRGNAELLLHEADTAMYQAKSNGGSRSALYDADLARVAEGRNSAQVALKSALDEERVIPHYQPIFNMQSGKIEGFEALARLVQRDGRILAPAAFIPIAEESGLVLALGAMVLERACEQACAWPSTADGGTLNVAVNVSSRQFERGDLTSVVGDILSRTGLYPPRLHLELTETAIMDLHPETVRQVFHLRDLGVQIGLDDFGTGYASLTHLRRLPLDFVKVDRSFVQGLGADAGDERIVSAVIDLARNLNLRSVAEGVETMEQYHRLLELGCDQAQGYLVARPAPPDQLSFDGYRFDAAAAVPPSKTVRT